MQTSSGTVEIMALSPPENLPHQILVVPYGSLQLPHKTPGALNEEVEHVVTKLKRREVHGSFNTAMHTAKLLRKVISLGKFNNVQECIDLVKMVGKNLIAAAPLELAIGNIVRRVLYVVRQEFTASLTEVDKNQLHQQLDMAASLHKLLDSRDDEVDFSKPFIRDIIQFTPFIVDLYLKQSVIEELGELIEEVEQLYTYIAEQAIEHIHANEIILTCGFSRTVTSFLKAAHKMRTFEVIVAETAPNYEGHKMAVNLASMGISTTVITDSAVFAMMARVNKVILGTHAVMADGGLLAHTGVHNLAVAAKHFSVPFVVLTGLFKLCPLYSFDQDTFNENTSPSSIIDFQDEYVSDKVDVLNPAYDYVPPEYVSLLVSNVGGHSPSYIYRLLSEYYSSEDYQL